MTRWIVIVLALLVTATAAAQKSSSRQRAVPGAGWASVPIPGNGGEQIYRRYCWECHGEGPDHPGTAALQAKYQGAVPALLHQRTDMNAPFVITTVRQGISIMPSMRDTEISDAELKAIAAYLTRERR